MKVATEHLIDAALDWAAARALQLPVTVEPIGRPEPGSSMAVVAHAFGTFIGTRRIRLSSDWSQGGPAMEQLLGNGMKVRREGGQFEALLPVSIALESLESECLHGTGATPLIAVMRCLVRATFGDAVEVPAVLVKPETVTLDSPTIRMG